MCNLLRCGRGRSIGRSFLKTAQEALTHIKRAKNVVVPVDVPKKAFVEVTTTRATMTRD